MGVVVNGIVGEAVWIAIVGCDELVCCLRVLCVLIS